ncbi:MAG: NAD(P)/FAD-dependent oxidoreductase [Clostridia bacterium]|nr:NAD(P)/FAD-dependent oxidoreductase [Clostridia bacterium]
MQHNKCIVVGGGASGMLAALYAARGGARVTLLERNEKLGKKLYITGKGRCNVTNASDMEQYQRNIFRNPRFLYAAFAHLDNAGMMALVEDLGTPLKVERGNRVFPVSDKSSDIIAALKRGLDGTGVDIRLNTRVAQLLTEDGQCVGVALEDGRSIYADAVILATGGLSYPSTGSTGDGHAMARDVGHTVTPTLPALVAIDTVESWPGTLAGLTLKNVTLTAFITGGKKEKRLYSQMGELLFTHTGISGPLALTLSSLLPEALSTVRMSIDLKPALDEQTLDARLLRDFSQLSRKQLSSVVDGLAPRSLSEQLIRLAGLSPTMPVNNVTARQRAALLKVVKGIELHPKGLGGFNEAIITRGGVNVKEINPSTMQSKRLKNLYLCGELMDVDAATGGYNLQIAFSTGALAGRSAAAMADD